MSSTQRKLGLFGSFGLLAIIATVSCTGFFKNPTLTSIAVSPATPQVAINTQLTPALQVFGTYDDGSRNLVSSGVNWSSSDPTIASVDPVSGVLMGVALGTATITASAQGLSGTATATVFLTGISSMTVSPTTGTISTSSPSVTFSYTANANGGIIPITTDTGGVLTITPTTTDITCSASGDQEICTGDGVETAGTYSFTMTYPGTSASATAVVTDTE